MQADKKHHPKSLFLPSMVRHDWGDIEEFVLDKAMTTFLRRKGLRYRHGEKLRIFDLWQRGGKQAGLQIIILDFKQLVDTDSSLTEHQKQKMSMLTDEQIGSKVSNMAKNSHWEWHSPGPSLEQGYIRRTLEYRQGKRNQKILYANFQQRQASAARIWAGPVTQAAARERQHSWAETRSRGSSCSRQASKSIQLAHSRGRDIFCTWERLKNLLGTDQAQVQERSCREDLENYVRCRDVRCISQVLSTEPLNCVVCEEYSDVAGEKKVRYLSDWVPKEQRLLGTAYENNSELDHTIPAALVAVLYYL